MILSLLSTNNKNGSNNNNNDKNNIKKIMVLDDDLDIATIVKTILQRSGLKNVFEFTNPLLALEHFRINHNDYSLVISDIRMCGMNGFEFVRNITQIKPEIKVLLMTAFDINDNDLLTMSLKYDNNDKISRVIQKPVSSKQLAKVVSETIMN